MKKITLLKESIGEIVRLSLPYYATREFDIMLANVVWLCGGNLRDDDSHILEHSTYARVMKMLGQFRGFDKLQIEVVEQRSDTRELEAGACQIGEYQDIKEDFEGYTSKGLANAFDKTEKVEKQLVEA